MIDELNHIIEELQEKIKSLTAENEYLTERSEEIYLLSLVTESIYGISDPFEIIETVLEKISVLKDIPFCSYGEIKNNQLDFPIVYASYAESVSVPSLKISESLIKSVKNGILFINEKNASDHFILDHLTTQNFKAKSLLLIPSKTESGKVYLFIFADVDINTTRLKNMTVMLQETIHNLNTKLDNLELIKKLKDLSLSLEKRISEKTSELWDANNLLREQIKDRQKIEDDLRIRNDELNNFVYRVSHDLRAPITSVEGLINIIKLEIPENDANISSYINMLEDRVKNLDRFIRDILSYSRNINTKIKTDLIDFNVILNSCFEELTYLEGASTINRQIEIKGSEFFNDKIRIFEIFRNLVSNAIKYANPDEEEKWVKINIEVDHTAARIQIIDNGIGISKSALPNIFDMFYRGSEHSKGSGIGLFIVKQAIDKLNGTISVKSELKIGTEFQITIPNNRMIKDQ